MPKNLDQMTQAELAALAFKPIKPEPPKAKPLSPGEGAKLSQDELAAMIFTTP